MRKHLELLQKVAEKYHEDINSVTIGEGRPAPDGLIRTYCQMLRTMIKIKEELASKSVLNE